MIVFDITGCFLLIVSKLGTIHPQRPHYTKRKIVAERQCHASFILAVLPAFHAPFLHV
jgi:hypothetical protein